MGGIAPAVLQGLFDRYDKVRLRSRVRVRARGIAPEVLQGLFDIYDKVRLELGLGLGSRDRARCAAGPLRPIRQGGVESDCSVGVMELHYDCAVIALWLRCDCAVVAL